MKKSPLLYTLILGASILSGCASIDQSGINNSVIFNDVSSVIKEVRSADPIEPGGSVKVKIHDDSPFFNGVGIKGKFATLKLTGKAGQQYTFVSYAHCDCLGFRKWAVSPHLLLVGESGGIAKAEMVAPAPRVRHLKGVFPADGVYYLMVVADWESRGKKLQDVNIGVAPPGGMYDPNFFTVPMTSHPTGSLQISWAN